LAQKPNLRSAALDFGFVAVALIVGWVGAPLAAAALVYLAAVLGWWWTRRRALDAMPLRPRLTQSAMALLMLAVVLGLFYWIGRAAGGHG